MCHMNVVCFYQCCRRLLKAQQAVVWIVIVKQQALQLCSSSCMHITHARQSSVQMQNHDACVYASRRPKTQGSHNTCVSCWSCAAGIV